MLALPWCELLTCSPQTLESWESPWRPPDIIIQCHRLSFPPWQSPGSLERVLKAVLGWTIHGCSRWADYCWSYCWYLSRSYFFSKMCHQGSLGIRPGCWPRSPEIQFSRLCFRDWSFTLMRGGQRIMLECWGNTPGEEGGEKERRSSSWFYRAGSGRFDSEKEIFRHCKIW